MEDSTKYSWGNLALLVVLIIIGRGIYYTLYSYGGGTHTNQLPLIKHAINPAYLASDWNVIVRSGIGSPRFIYTQSVAVIAQVFGVPATVFSIYFVSTIIGVGSLYILLNEFFEDRFVSILSIGVILSPVMLIIHLGRNSLFSSSLIPSHLANALILLGLVFILRDRYDSGFAVLGVATCFHVVNGFWMTLVAGICIIWIECSCSARSISIREAVECIPWRAAGLYGIIASIGIVPLLIENLSSSTGFYPIYLMAWVRHPHHYVPSMWIRWQFVTTSLFIMGSTILLWYYRKIIFPSERSEKFAFAWIGTLTLVFVSGGVFTEIYAIPFVIKLQPFHIDDFLFIILWGGLLKLSVCLFRSVTDYPLRFPSNFLSKATVGILALALILAPMVGLTTNPNTQEEPKFTVYEEPEYGSNLSEAYKWIATETSDDAVFIANPELNGFRLKTSRAMVINIKSFPFRPSAMTEWGERIKNVCGINGLLTNSDLSRCESNYTRLDENVHRQNAAQYEACWVLSKNKTYAFEQRFSNEKYTVYYLNDSAHC